MYRNYIMILDLLLIIIVRYELYILIYTNIRIIKSLTYHFVNCIDSPPILRDKQTESSHVKRTHLFACQSPNARRETSSRNVCSQSCSHGTDKDVYMSVPCVLGREGVCATVRQKLNDQEKAAVQRCADGIRNVLRECGILRESTNDVEE